MVLVCQSWLDCAGSVATAILFQHSLPGVIQLALTGGEMAGQVPEEVIPATDGGEVRGMLCRDAHSTKIPAGGGLTAHSHTRPSFSPVQYAHRMWWGHSCVQQVDPMNFWSSLLCLQISSSVMTMRLAMSPWK